MRVRVWVFCFSLSAEKTRARNVNSDFVPLVRKEYVPPHLRNGVQVPSQPSAQPSSVAPNQQPQQHQQAPTANYNNYYNQMPNVGAGGPNGQGYSSINTSNTRFLFIICFKSS